MKQRIIPEQPTYPGGLLFYEDEPYRDLTEGDLLREVWEDIDARERAIIEVLNVVRRVDECRDYALVRRGNGQTETVVLPPDLKLVAGHDFDESFRLSLLAGKMRDRGL